MQSAPRMTEYRNLPAEPAEIQAGLDKLLLSVDRHAWLANDPLQFVHRYRDPVDQEVVGLVASSLAFGQVSVVLKNVERVLSILGPQPATRVREAPRSTLTKELRGFVHRIYRGPHVARLLANAGAMLREHGSIGGAFHKALRREGRFREALATVASELRGARADRSMRHLISDPMAGSASKRLLLYMRWMVRPADGLDLGLWNVSPAQLVMPVDTHVHRIARLLGLTERRDASWRTAEEITERLRAFDPDDPVKYDFALCHLGISRQCPTAPVVERCEACVLKPICRVWR